MSQIDTTLARIPTMTAASRATLRRNAAVCLVKTPDDEATRRIMAALDHFEALGSKLAGLETTGQLAWERHRHGQTTFRAFHGDEHVGHIFKRADHSTTEKDVYAVEILGQRVPAAFHHIRDAREAGERAFAAAVSTTRGPAQGSPAEGGGHGIGKCFRQS